MKKILVLAGLLCTAACSPPPTKVWLNEYEQILRETVQTISENSSSSEAEKMRLKLSQKEAQINDLLKSASMQEQMSFLSEYYDMRVRFFYQLQQQ